LGGSTDPVVEGMISLKKCYLLSNVSRMLAKMLEMISQHDKIMKAKL